MTPIRRSFTLVLISGLFWTAPAQVNPGDEGMSREILDAGVGLYRRAVERGELAGAVLLVARHGKIVLHQAVGWRDLDRRLPMEKDTLFRMASNTKPVIATAVLMLAEEKKLSLDDYVRKYLPSFDNDRAREIRISHLLSHTSGMRIRDASGQGVIFFKPLLQKSAGRPDAPSLQAEVARFGAIGSEKPPGSSYSYSDPGYNTLGAVIEVVSGQPLGTFLRERIYEPLGMAETSNHESKSPNQRMAVVYKGAGDDKLSVVWKPGDPPDYPFVRASGGMITSAADYLKFCQMFLNGGELDGKRILSAERVKAAITPAAHTEHPYRGGLSWYGYGWELFERGVYGHHGSDGTYAWVDPKTGVIAFVLTQTQRGGDVRAQFLKAVEAAAAAEKSPFCTDCGATREFLKSVCEFIVKERSDFTANTKSARTIFTNGYYMRTLVAGYRIFKDRRYLDVAVRYGDHLLNLQSPRGYWGTGYGNIYLADTGSAIGLFVVLHPLVDAGRQRKYLESVKRYATAIEADGLINPSGAIGTGWRATEDGVIRGPYRDEYTISSALTGGMVFTWMYHMTKEDNYRRVAYNALRWILATMREDGCIPYVLAGEGTALGRIGDPEHDFRLWERARYLTSAYVGEGLLSFDKYCGQPVWQGEIRAKIRPHIEFLLRTQNADGTWAVKDTKTAWDQKRSPGIINLLTWYYENVEKDPRIVEAVRKFDRFLLVPEQAKSFGMLNAGAQVDFGVSSPETRVDCVTGIGGRAVADILAPAIDAKW